MTERRLQEAEEALGMELMGFIEDAVGQILEHEDEGGFLTWVRNEAPRRLPGLFADLPNEQAARAITFELGRDIWNKIPLPGAGFRTRAIPRPERNEPCPCDSGQKFKRCCGAIAGVGRLDLPFEAEDGWTLVLAQTPELEIAQLSADRRIPRALIPGIAERLIDYDDAEAAQALLEPLFVEPEQLDERDSPALDVLFEVYDELGLQETKEREIERLEATLRPALRLALWEALAKSYTSQGDSGRAWEMAQRIRRLDPDSPVLGWVEVILLLGENRLDEAADRAKAALAAHERHPGLSDEALSWLEEAAADPASTRRRLLLDDLQGSVERFQKLLAPLAGRPTPPYPVALEPAAPPAGRLVLPDELGAVEEGWVEAAFAVDGAGEEDDGVEDEEEEEDEDGWEEVDGEEAEDLEESGADDELEEDDEEDDDAEEEGEGDWEDDADDDWDEEDEEDWEEEDAAEQVWHPTAAHRWLTYLEEHPQAFDSLGVIADLLVRVSDLLPRDPSLKAELYDPLVRRGVALLDASLAGAPEVTLPADLDENLAALEILEASASLTDEPVPEVEPLERLLRLDPLDHLGASRALGTAYLWRNEPQKTLDLAARYATDDEPFLPFAKVIALKQLDRREEALAALDAAVENHPQVAAAFAASSQRVPEALLELWQVDDELWQELGKRVDALG